MTETLPQYKLPHIFTLSGELLDRLNEGSEAEPKPTLIQPSAKMVQRKLIHNSCPLCGAMPINNPAVLPSGYVYCYTCAFNYVEEQARCPVTSLAVPEARMPCARSGLMTDSNPHTLSHHLCLSLCSVMSCAVGSFEGGCAVFRQASLHLSEAHGCMRWLLSLKFLVSLSSSQLFSSTTYTSAGSIGHC